MHVALCTLNATAKVVIFFGMRNDFGRIYFHGCMMRAASLDLHERYLIVTY